MTHEELIESSMDKEFELARSMILDGLSNRLVNFEKSTKLGQSLNLAPRTKYPNPETNEAGVIQKKDLDFYKQQLNPSKPVAQPGSNPYAKRSVNPVTNSHTQRLD